MEYLDSQESTKGMIGRIATTEHTTAYQEKINNKQIEVVNLNNYDTPFEAIMMVSKGYWPEDLDNPKSKWIAPTPDTWKKVALHAYEGLSTFSDYMGGSQVHGGLAARAGRKERVGPAEETISFTDGSAAIGGNSRSHYNIVQTYIRGAVADSHRLPVYLVWTGHEAKAKDDLTGLPIVGPEVFGMKATQYVPRWFANVVHLSQVGKDTTDKQGNKSIDWTYKMWLRDHYEPSAPSVPFKAKTSINWKYKSEIPPCLDGGGAAIGDFVDLLKKYNQIGK